MYQDNTSQVIGAAIVSATGVAALPVTGGHTVFVVAAYAAIGIGLIVLLLQTIVGAYRLYLRRR